MQQVLIAIHLIVVLGLIGTVLLQRSEGGVLGSGGGGGFMTGRGQANALSRATAILAALYFATALLMSILASWGRASGPIIGAPAPAGQSQPASEGPAPAKGSLLDQLKKPADAPASAPAAPAPAPADAPK